MSRAFLTPTMARYPVGLTIVTRKKPGQPGVSQRIGTGGPSANDFVMRRGGVHRCVWQSMSPGITVDLERSITVAPAGTAPPTALILAPSMRITWLVETVPVSGSIRWPALIAVSG